MTLGLFLSLTFGAIIALLLHIIKRLEQIQGTIDHMIMEHLPPHKENLKNNIS